MPLELAVWRLDQGLTRLPPQGMDLEERLEDLLAKDISIASSDWMVIARQVPTPWGKRVDLLALDRDGNLVVLELKRNKTEREVVAQVLDYGSWARKLRADDLARMFNDYLKSIGNGGPVPSLNEEFCRVFGVRQMPEELNEEHELVIVGASFDPATERIVEYLAEEHDVSINAVFFRVFKDGDREYLTRAWLRETDESTAERPQPFSNGSAGASLNRSGRPVVPNPKTEWNGEYYVSFGHSRDRTWEDALRYGFISAGGGAWYTNTLEMLEPGDRVWVNIPGGVGYVGVGEVTAPRVRADQFMVPDKDGKLVSYLQADKKATGISTTEGEWEYIVPVKWIKTVPLEQAVKETGFFGNQNSVARPRDAKWTFTVDRLKERFGIKDANGAVTSRP